MSIAFIDGRAVSCTCRWTVTGAANVSGEQVKYAAVRDLATDCPAHGDNPDHRSES